MWPAAEAVAAPLPLPRRNNKCCVSSFAGVVTMMADVAISSKLQVGGEERRRVRLGIGAGIM